LEADTKYRISFDAAAWYETPDIRFYLLDTDGNVVASLTKNLTAKISDRASTDKPEHIELTADITKTGNYILKFTSAGQILYSNIVIRKDLTTALEENFSELHNSVPSTGWIFYNNGSAVKQGSSVSSGARVFKISGYDAITNVAYLGWNGTCYLTYGEENSGKSLTLVAGQEYRITYYAANWDGNTEYTRTMACEITGADGQGVVFSRKDELSGVCNGVAGSAAFKKNPDFIQATFTPEKSGNYILKFTGLNAAVANISIKTNEDGVAYVSSLDKFGYTSLYLDQAVSLPDGVTAYIGKLNAAKDAIVLTELEGEVIPANTGVILVGDANAELKFYPTTASATTPTGNILQGVVKGTKASSSDDVYVLGYKSSDKAPAFYKNTTKKIEATTTITIDEGANKATIVTDYKIQEGSTNSTDRTEATDDWTTTTTTTNSDNEQVTTTKVNYEAGTKTKSYEYVQVIRANKAYFVLPASDPATASSIRIQFGEDTDEPGNVTAIERIETEAAPAARVIYDLSGRRLTDMSKPGLYIVNGRKMLVK
jgi:Tfp pilus assembly major pilin PilA